ncbi:MAG: MBL fold metallo-hydrolase, partial [Erysipelotrichaceae bacterium]|nr:MBL fold metallo-hydrolase [Erysipelotrichaceae bacterium]
MFFKKIETKGLSHYSYMIGDGNDIAIIDPMRDVQVYMHEAREAGMRIKYIFETHRNEDFIAGSMELAEKTGATIYISAHEDLKHVY